MSAGTWKVFTRAKRYIANAGGISLAGGTHKMMLLKASACTNLLKITNAGVSTWNSVKTFEITANAAYVVNGKAITPLWTVLGGNATTMKYAYATAGLVFTANGAALNNIKFAAIRYSAGASAGTSKLLCWCSLSSSPFTISIGNTLTIKPAANGVFTLK